MRADPDGGPPQRSRLHRRRLECEELPQQRQLALAGGEVAVRPRRQLHLPRHRDAALRLHLRRVYRLLHTHATVTAAAPHTAPKSDGIELWSGGGLV